MRGVVHERSWTNQTHPTTVPPGPWSEEPDGLHWVDEVTGLECLMLRNPVGAWCGYVGVPPGHWWNGAAVDECIWWCDEPCDHDGPHILRNVHGGRLTFAGLRESGSAGGLCRLHVGDCRWPAVDRPEAWWFGFHCAYGADLSPRNVGLYVELPGVAYRDVGYVRAQVDLLADQLAQVDRYDPDWHEIWS